MSDEKEKIEPVDLDDTLNWTMSLRRKLVEKASVDQDKLLGDESKLAAVIALLRDLDGTALKIKKAANDKLSNENTAEAINLVKGVIEGITSNPFLGKSPSGNHSETDVSKLPEIEVIPGETDIGHHAVCYESFIETVGAKKPRTP